MIPAKPDLPTASAGASPQPSSGGPAAGDARRPLLRVLADWAAGLEYADIPQPVINLATSQVISGIAAARASMAHPIGDRVRTAFGDPATLTDPKDSAQALAALTAALYLEDTVYAGHVSHAAVNVPVAYAARSALSGRDLIMAVITATECAARITAATTLSQFRGQLASHTHLVAAVAARLKLAGARAETWVNAWGLALAAPPLPLRRGFMGSDAKVLSAAFPVRIGLDSCAAAQAGLTGADDLLEHPDGLLALIAAVPMPDAITQGLGTRWHTQTLSLKIHPAGIHVDAAIDCAIALRDRVDVAELDRITQITVFVPRITIEMDRRSLPYLNGEDSPLAALNLSAGYNIATALLTGALGPADLARPRLAEPRRWALAEKIRLVHDEAMSRKFMLGTAPFGEALRQAGDRAKGWVTTLAGIPIEELIDEAGPPSESFANSSKILGARIEVLLENGRKLTCSRERGLGAAGPAMSRDHATLARRKLCATGAGAGLARTLARIPELSSAELAPALTEALTCPGPVSSDGYSLDSKAV